jgi:hypothetical protein
VSTTLAIRESCLYKKPKSLKLIASVNDTAEKLFSGVNDTGDKFFGGVAAYISLLTPENEK